jgi:hypothetical protein
MTLALIADDMGDDTSLEQELLQNAASSAQANPGGWTPHPLPAVAGRASGFELTVSAYDPYSPSLPDTIQRADPVADLVAGAHVLSLHAPLTQETRGAIGAAALAGGHLAGKPPQHPVVAAAAPS